MPYTASGQHDNTCYFCHRPIPKYESGGIVYSTGFVPPSGPRTEAGVLTKEEAAHVVYRQGPGGITVTAIEERCCRPCYLEEFRRLHPGAEVPHMPRPVSDEELMRELMAGTMQSEERARPQGTVVVAGTED